MEVKFIPEKQNIGVDILSRYTRINENRIEPSSTITAIKEMEYSKKLKSKLRYMALEQVKDEKLRKLKNKLKTNVNEYLTIREDVLFSKEGK